MHLCASKCIRDFDEITNAFVTFFAALNAFGSFQIHVGVTKSARSPQTPTNLLKLTKKQSTTTSKTSGFGITIPKMHLWERTGAFDFS